MLPPSTEKVPTLIRSALPDDSFEDDAIKSTPNCAIGERGSAQASISSQSEDLLDQPYLQGRKKKNGNNVLFHIGDLDLEVTRDKFTGPEIECEKKGKNDLRNAACTMIGTP
jgi:hypothetical protein